MSHPDKPYRSEEISPVGATPPPPFTLSPLYLRSKPIHGVIVLVPASSWAQGFGTTSTKANVKSIGVCPTIEVLELLG